MSSGISIRLIQPEDIPQVVEWASQEGWHVSVNIVKASIAFDPKGVFVACDADGCILGCIAGCILDDNTASGGFYIVKKTERRKGIGRLLWDARLQYLGNRNLSIAAVQNRVQPNKQRGFTHMSYCITAYSGVPQREQLSPTSTDNCQLLTYNADMFHKVLAYDSQIHTIPREAFLKQWIDPWATTTLLASDKEGHIIGYGCSQPTNKGAYHIGPIYADDPQVAVVIFNNLARVAPEGAKVAVDILSEGDTFRQVVKIHGFSFEEDLYRMYNKNNIALPLEKVFCISTCGISLV